LTNNRNVILLNVNRELFTVDTRRNKNDAAITIGVSVNIFNSCFNGTLRVTDTVTSKGIITVNRVNVDNLSQFDKRTTRSNSYPSTTIPNRNSLVSIILKPGFTYFPV